MKTKLERLKEALHTVLGDRIQEWVEAFGEITMVVDCQHYMETMQLLCQSPELCFDELVDLCGVDYMQYGKWEGDRFAVAVHLLSLKHNWRVRVKVFLPDTEPRLPSLIRVWPSVDWYEREAFDLFGILFDEHPDLRRILTDYGFVGYPFRKDFPVQGYVEMRYDEEQKRVVYQPVSIENREIVPRIVREEDYGRR